MITTSFLRGMLVCALVAPAGAAAAAPAAPDPWSKVPAPPTGCFTDDGFQQKLVEAMDAMAADIDRQTEINDAVAEQYRTLDPAVMQSRMMEFMTEHPQQAMEFMQKMQAIGQNSGGEQFQILAERKKSLEDEYSALKRNFDDALQSSWGPARALMAALGDGCGARPPGPKELAAVDRVNAEYRRLCGEYWGPGGHYGAWLKKYQEFLMKVEVPAHEALDKQNLEVWSVMKIPTGTFRSTAGMTAVRGYMQEVLDIYQSRWSTPWRGH